MGISRLVLVVVVAGHFAACSTDSASGTVEGELISACSWPSAADTFDAGEGCLPKSMFDICQVPSGSIILADGGILTPDGGTAVCSDYCSPSEYALTCSSTGGPQTPIPSPDSSLDCTVIPIPTPSNALFWCCPCGP
jgi:hypothetical protein